MSDSNENMSDFELRKGIYNTRGKPFTWQDNLKFESAISAAQHMRDMWNAVGLMGAFMASVSWSVLVNEFPSPSPDLDPEDAEKLKQTIWVFNAISFFCNIASLLAAMIQFGALNQLLSSESLARGFIVMNKSFSSLPTVIFIVGIIPLFFSISIYAFFLFGIGNTAYVISAIFGIFTATMCLFFARMQTMTDKIFSFEASRVKTTNTEVGVSKASVNIAN